MEEFEMWQWRWRNVLGIPRREHRTNESLVNELNTTRKLIAKVVLLGMWHGKRLGNLQPERD